MNINIKNSLFVRINLKNGEDAFQMARIRISVTGCNSLFVTRFVITQSSKVFFFMYKYGCTLVCIQHECTFPFSGKEQHSVVL